MMHWLAAIGLGILASFAFLYHVGRVKESTSRILKHYSDLLDEVRTAAAKQAADEAASSEDESEGA